MGTKELRQELESLGIETRTFVEKIEFINALVHARNSNRVGNTTPPSSAPTGGLSSNDHPSLMGTKELRQELESCGVDTATFREKSEFITALVNIRKTSKNDAAKQSNVRQSKRLKVAASSSSSEEKKNLFATTLLRTSLLSSLGRVLEQINCGITLEAVLKMGALPEGSALIAGSSMVAACLGKYDWKGDVDVYCSAEGAPLVRSVRKYLLEVSISLFI
jgi:hypothetical protein